MQPVWAIIVGGIGELPQLFNQYTLLRQQFDKSVSKMRLDTFNPHHFFCAWFNSTCRNMRPLFCRLFNQLVFEKLLKLYGLDDPQQAAVLLLQSDDVLNNQARDTFLNGCLHNKQRAGGALVAANKNGGRISAFALFAQ